MCVCVCSYAFAFGGRGSLSTLVLLVMLASGGEFADARLLVSFGFLATCCNYNVTDVWIFSVSFRASLNTCRVGSSGGGCDSGGGSGRHREGLSPLWLDVQPLLPPVT